MAPERPRLRAGRPRDRGAHALPNAGGPSGGLVAVALGAALVFSASRAQGYVLAEDELAESSSELGVITRSFGFWLAGDTVRPPFTPEDQSPAALGILNLRSYVSYHSPSLRLVWHQSTESVLRSHASLGLLALGRGATPPRWLPLRAVLADRPTLRLTSEADWAYAALSAGALTLTLGRQPVTLGRGQLFRPWDLVSSFSLTEVDTEYKPGVDALRLDVTPSSRTTLSAIGSAGELAQDHDFEVEGRGSVLLLQLKQSFSRGEFAGLAGLVRNDLVFGWNAFWALDALDVYAEFSATHLTEHSLSAPAVTGRKLPVLRALGGAALHPWPHWVITPEVYYDGFGARRPRDYLPVALSQRVAVGEQTTLGKLYSGVAFDFEAHPLVHLTALALADELDPSALLSAGLRYDAGPNTRLVVQSYLPLGRAPSAEPVPAARSEFGLYPYFTSFELEVSL